MLRHGTGFAWSSTPTTCRFICSLIPTWTRSPNRRAMPASPLEVGAQPFDVDHMVRYIEIGRILDAKILRVALDGPDAARPVSELAAEFALLLPSAREAGIRIAIENHFNFPSRRLVELLAAIDDDQVAVCLDVAELDMCR